MERNRMVCTRVKEASLGIVIARSTIEKCEVCGENIYLTPASKIVAMRNDSMLVCVECVREEVNSLPDEEEVTIFGPSIGQIEELIEDRRKN